MKNRFHSFITEEMLQQSRSIKFEKRLEADLKMRQKANYSLQKSAA